MSDVELRSGMVFNIMEKARITIMIWFFRNGWFFKVPISNAQRLIHKYKDKNCPFTLNINALKKGIRLTKLIHHTYPIFIYNKWRNRSSIAIISKDLLNIGLFVNDLNTKPARIRRQELRIYNNYISIYLIWEVYERIKRDLYEDEAKLF